MPFTYATLTPIGLGMGFFLGAMFVWSSASKLLSTPRASVLQPLSPSALAMLVTIELIGGVSILAGLAFSEKIVPFATILGTVLTFGFVVYQMFSKTFASITLAGKTRNAKGTDCGCFAGHLRVNNSTLALARATFLFGVALSSYVLLREAELNTAMSSGGTLTLALFVATFLFTILWSFSVIDGWLSSRPLPSAIL